jgi:protocatechuate 3,4-dioxygenase beta subunit
MSRETARAIVLTTLLVAAAPPLVAQREFEVPTRAPADAPAAVTMVDSGEPGAPLLVSGQVVGAEGPVSEVSVFAYQTDAEGIYSDVGNRRPRIRGYARTDAEGRFELHTIRPASYPGTRVQQHIHFHLAPANEDGGETVGEIVFDDDPLLSERQRRDPAFVVCSPTPGADGVDLCPVTLRLSDAGGARSR